jgi:hypothetical protein
MAVTMKMPIFWDVTPWGSGLSYVSKSAYTTSDFLDNEHTLWINTVVCLFFRHIVNTSELVFIFRTSRVILTLLPFDLTMLLLVGVAFSLKKGTSSCRC